MRDLEFYKRLFFGNGGEYLVISDFIIRGFEAVKISPDFGYDIHVTNKYKIISQEVDTEQEINLFLQVKTRLIYPEVSDTTLEVMIDKNNFSNLLSDDKSYLVIVALKGIMVNDSWSDDPLKTFDINSSRSFQKNLEKWHYQYFEPYYYIWLSHKDLLYLHENNFTSEFNRDNYKRIKIRCDKGILIDNNNDPHILGHSRTYLFSMTNMDFWTYNHKNLFI